MSDNIKLNLKDLVH